jgi:hypothetical protein
MAFSNCKNAEEMRPYIKSSRLKASKQNVGSAACTQGLVSDPLETAFDMISPECLWFVIDSLISGFKMLISPSSMRCVSKLILVSIVKAAPCSYSLKPPASRFPWLSLNQSIDMKQ